MWWWKWAEDYIVQQKDESREFEFVILRRLKLHKVCIIYIEHLMNMLYRRQRVSIDKWNFNWISHDESLKFLLFKAAVYISTRFSFCDADTKFPCHTKCSNSSIFFQSLKNFSIVITNTNSFMWKLCQSVFLCLTFDALKDQLERNWYR